MSISPFACTSPDDEKAMLAKSAASVQAIVDVVKKG